MKLPFLLAAHLPAGPAPPMHIMEPSSDTWSWLYWVAGFALLLVVAYLLAPKQTEAPEVEPPSPTPPAPPADPGFVAQIRIRYDREGDFRHGCHLLAAGLREYLGRERRLDLDASTVTEIEAEVSDRQVVQVFKFLRRLQFQRFEPSRKDFYEACDRTSALTAIAQGDADDAADAEAGGAQV